MEVSNAPEDGIRVTAVGEDNSTIITNTQVKLIVVLEEVAVAVREAEVKIFMERFHRLYVDTMSNPFVEIGAKITSKQFKAGLQQLLSQGR